MITDEEKRLNAINKVLDKFITYLEPELIPVFKRIRGKIIEILLRDYIQDIIKDPKSLPMTLHIIIITVVLKNINEVKTTPAKNKLNRIRKVAGQLIQKAIKDEQIKKIRASY